MATKLPDNEMTQFENVRINILETFNPLILQLTARRNALLEELSRLKYEFETKEKARKEAIEEIERTQKRFHAFSFKVNTNIPLHQKADDLYKQGLEDLKKTTKIPLFLFSFTTLKTLQTLISEFGDLLDWEEPNYVIKSEPILSIEGGLNQFNGVGLAIDEAKKLIYITDNSNSRVQVVSFEGNFVSKFGRDILKGPWGIALSEEDILVTDTSLDSLFQFDRTSLKLKNRTGSRGKEGGKLNIPNGLSIDRNGDVYVADSSNHRVSVFSKALQFKNWIGAGKLQHAQDVQLTKDCVVVLDLSPSCVHFFSRNGTLLSSCVSRGFGQDSLIQYSNFFCLDLAENIIISDSNHHAIKIFSKDGKHIHTFGKRGDKKGDLFKPYGICVSKIGTIFVVSHNFNYPLQCF